MEKRTFGRLLFLFLSVSLSLPLCAQDVIVQRDGTTILSKVLEVGKTEVKYKKWSNRQGPTYTIEKSELLSINYQNGEKDVFNTVESQLTATPAVTNTPEQSAPAGGTNEQYGGRDYHPNTSMTAEQIISSVSQSQPFALFKEGARATYIMEVNGQHEKWGPISTSYIQQVVTKTAVENGVLAVYIQLRYLNKKMEDSKPIDLSGGFKKLKERIYKVEIDPKGNYHLTHNLFYDAWDIFKGRKGFAVFVPSDMKQGMKLDCGQITQQSIGRAGGYRNSVTTYSDWEVLGEGTLEVPAGKFQCVKVRGKVAIQEDSAKTPSEGDITCWIARGVGIIRYDIGSGNVKYLLNEIENYK